jgi:hypothetical protein
MHFFIFFLSLHNSSTAPGPKVYTEYHKQRNNVSVGKARPGRKADNLTAI